MPSRDAHRWAWLMACATFPLVWWGGFVTATGAGMAFREWLTPDGSLLPLYPWLSSAGDKFIEHGHRLLAMLVGLLTIALVIVLHFRESRRWVRIFGWALLGGVLLQGGLGGLRVVMDKRTIALLHGCVGPLFFAATAAMVAVTSPNWRRQQASRLGDTNASMSLARLAVITAALTWLQLVVGAIVRHSPYLLGESAAVIFRSAVYAHLGLAAIVSVQVLRLAVAAWRRGVSRRIAGSMAALVLVQLVLGASTWILKYGVPQWAVGTVGEWRYVNTEADLVRASIITAHGAVGALLVALGATLAIQAAGAAGVTWHRTRAAAARGAVA